MQEVNFYCGRSFDQKPTSKRTMYVDGTGGAEFRDGIDGELSHWNPNRTEEKYKAGTSTEICLKYLALNRDIDYDLVVNNHLDIDGVLSVFVLAYPTIARKHEAVLIDAAKVGDFWAWADGKALKVFQLLSLLFEKCEAANISLQESYQRCFSLILRILDSQNDKTTAERILTTQYALIEQGKIIREELNDRVVSYHVPQNMIKDKIYQHLLTPKANEPISNRIPFWPQVRNRLDEEKIQLVSFDTGIGITYELWMPGYCWADTKGLWLPPGHQPPTDMRGLIRIQWPTLSKIAAQLNTQEQGSCYWTLFEGFDFFNTKNHRDFPIILTTVSRGDEGVTSQQSLNVIKEVFRQLT